MVFITEIWKVAWRSLVLVARELEQEILIIGDSGQIFKPYMVWMVISWVIWVIDVFRKHDELVV